MTLPVCLFLANVNISSTFVKCTSAFNCQLFLPSLILSFSPAHFMSTHSLFQKQLPQMASSVRYQPQQSAPLTQVGTSSAAASRSCFSLRVFPTALVVTAVESSTQRRQMGRLFCQHCEGKTKQNGGRLINLDLIDCQRFE